MTNPYIGGRVVFDVERTLAAPFTGVAQDLGTPLTFPAVVAIFDNQSTVSVEVVVNGIVWKTFPGGEALVLDLRANHGNAPTYAIDANTQFQINGVGGLGLFSLSLLYAR